MVCQGCGLVFQRVPAVIVVVHSYVCQTDKIMLLQGANTSSDSILLQRCLLQSLEMQDMARQGLCYIGNS